MGHERAARNRRAQLNLKGETTLDGCRMRFSHAATAPSKIAANFVRDLQIITLYKMHMRLLLVDFAALSAIAFLQIHCYAGDDVLNDKIVRATLNHSEPAVVKVGINGVTSLEFPYKIEAIDGYGFSQTPGSGDAFQISYTKGSNYFSVRALKPGVTGNLTVVLDQKVYSVFFEESNDPSFVNIFAPAASSGSTAPGERKVAQEGNLVPPAQPGALLEKVKGYALLKTSSPEMLDGLQVAEPGKKF